MKCYFIRKENFDENFLREKFYAIFHSWIISCFTSDPDRNISRSLILLKSVVSRLDGIFHMF